MKTQFKNIDQVWAVIETGKTVYFGNTAYEITVEPLNREWRVRCGFGMPFSTKGDQTLRVTCVSNYFGSLLEETDLNKLFTRDEN